MTSVAENRPIDTASPERAPGSHEKILIVDFGSQVTQLIARRVREEKVYCEIVPFQKAEAALRDMKPKGVILSGGPASVLDKDAPLAPMAIYQAGVPVLGICYGEQAMAHQLGGKVEAGHHREIGRAELELIKPSPLTDGVWQVGERYPVWMSHVHVSLQQPADHENPGQDHKRITRMPGNPFECGEDVKQHRQFKLI